MTKTIGSWYYRSGWLHNLGHRAAERLFANDQTWHLPVLTGPLRGLWLDLDLKWERQFLLDGYEAATVETLRRLIRPGMTCYDVGAHVGYFTLLMARLAGAGGTVIAFEPNPAIYARLERNLHQNAHRVGGTMHAFQLALSDQSGQAMFFRGGASTTGRLARFPKDARPDDLFEVQCTTADEFARNGGMPLPQFVKLDVEYVEDRVLAGMDELLKTKPIVVCEIHETGTGQRVLDQLLAHGYRIRGIEQAHELTGRDDAAVGHIYAVAP